MFFISIVNPNVAPAGILRNINGKFIVIGVNSDKFGKNLLPILAAILVAIMLGFMLWVIPRLIMFVIGSTHVFPLEIIYAVNSSER